MKKFSFIVLAIVFGLVFVPGVYPNDYGIKVGANFANINEEGGFYGFEIKTGFIVGGFYRFDLKGNLSIQPEVYFSMKGTKAAGEQTQFHYGEDYTQISRSTWDFSMKLNYLEVPVLLKFRFPSKRKFKPNVFLGPYAAFKLSAEVTGTLIFELTEEYGGEVHTESRDYTGGLINHKRGIDFGIVIGAGFDIGMGSGSLVIDARYTLGLSNIDKALPGENNSVFTLMLGYSFNLK
jgi:hypothetical protein